MRREPATLTRSLLVLALSLSTACVETASCPEGEGISEDGDGCAPLPRVDGSTPTDGGDGDAGPCGACPGATPLCREADGECVACLGDGDCGGDTPLCDDAGACVGCLGDADCDAPAAARCEAGACTGCDDSLQCAGISGTEVCDTDTATCVECTETEAGACGGSPCTTGGTCSAYGTAQEACEPCDTDANCADPDHYCVPMQYMGADRPGGYCLKSVSGGCEQPYSIATPTRTTLSGASGMTFCGINETLATCEAVRALLENQMCPGGADSECPEGGLCRTVGVLINRCTYQCGGTSECLNPPTAGNTCGDGTPPSAPDFCGG